ncbi:hypothetical protein ACQ4XT_11085 [Halobacillus faecis]
MSRILHTLWCRGVIHLIAFTYILIGLFFCFQQEEPVNQSREEKSIYMFVLLGWIILWPLFLIRLLFKGK